MGARAATSSARSCCPRRCPRWSPASPSPSIALIGYSAMAGAVGGGGLGDLAIRYGYQRFETDITVATVVVLARRRPAPAVRRRPPGAAPRSLTDAADRPARLPRNTRRSAMRRTRTLALAAAALAVGLAACGGDEQADAGAAAGPRSRCVVGASPVPHAEILRLRRRRTSPRTPAWTSRSRSSPTTCSPNTALEDGSARRQLLPDTCPTSTTRRRPPATTSRLGRRRAHRAARPLLRNAQRRWRDLPDGAQVAIPNDPTNEAARCGCSAANELITLKDGAGHEAPTVRDIDDNPKNLKFTEVEAAQTAALAGRRRRRGDQRQLRASRPT